MRIGALGAAIAVAAGAFGAHALADRLTPARLDTWKVASQYLLVHAVAIAVLSSATRGGGSGFVALWLLVAGCFIFSGSLYALCLTDVRVLGAITPIGGVCFIAGWITLAATLRWD
jgi:uncharacterized membrane protein YgdD (TMEM256/DUF423 family)